MLLEAPNPKDPQDAEVAKMMMEDHDFFECVAHDWAVKHAGAPRKQPPPDQHQRKTTQKKEDDIAKYVRALQTSFLALFLLDPSLLESQTNVAPPGFLDTKAGTRTSSTASSTWASTSTLSWKHSSMWVSTATAATTTRWRRHTWATSPPASSASNEGTTLWRRRRKGG